MIVASSRSACCSSTSFATALAVLDSDFINSFPSHRPGERRHPGRRSCGDDLADGASAAFIIPVGVGDGDLPRGVRGRQRWYNRLIEVNIQNLAAVPSIVYGILGLAFLVRGLGLGRVLLAGGLTLGLLVLPVVIIAVARGDPGRAAVDPRGLAGARRDPVADDLAPGAARPRSPASRPASILALSRAIGETAPLIVVGAADLHRVQPRRPRLRRSPRCRSRSSTGSQAANDATVQAARRGGDHRADDHAAADEHRRDLATQPIRAEGGERRSMTETEPKHREERPTAASTPSALPAPAPSRQAREAIFDVAGRQRLLRLATRPCATSRSTICRNEITA